MCRLNNSQLNCCFRWIGALLLSAGLFCLKPAMAIEESSVADAHGRLKAGDVLFEIIDGDQEGAAARVTALLMSDKESIWNIIGYCRYALIYVRGLKHCEMLQADGRYMVQHHRLKHSWYAPTLDFIFEARREAYEFGDARLVSGNLKVFEASWKLSSSEDGGGVVVIHEFRIKPKMPAPGWLIRRGLKNDLPDMLACIRGLAGASITAEDAGKDLGRCPGEILPDSKKMQPSGG